MGKLLTQLLGMLGAGTVNTDKLFEASGSFDSDLVQPFLEHLNTTLGLGLDASGLATFMEKVPADEEQSQKLQVPFKGKQEDIEYRVFKDDPYAPDLYFFSQSEALTNAIDEQLGAFFDEQGL